MMQGIASELMNIVVTRTIASPLNIIKTRLQCMDQLVRLGQIQTVYKGLWDCLTRIVKEQGLLALWKGNQMNIAIGIMSFAVNILVGSYIRKIMKNRSPQRPGLQRFFSVYFSGSVFGIVSLACTYPFQLAYNKMVNDVSNQFNSAIQIQRHVLQKQGVKGLYTGFQMSMLGVIIYRLSYFGLYDFIRHSTQPNNIFLSFLISIGVTLLAGLITYPIDLIRQRMITATGTQKKYRDSLQCVKTIKNNNGVTGFWRGAGTNIAKVLVSTIAFMIFEEIKKSWGQK